MITIEIPKRNYLLYLLLPHPLKMAFLTADSRLRLDSINREFTEAMYSGEAATGYDRLHLYGEDEQHEYPAQRLVSEVWAPDGYGRALEIGAGTGYFTAFISRRSTSVVAVEPVPDMQRVLRRRCETEALANVQITGKTWAELDAAFSEHSFDSVLLVQSLHHLHRREDAFALFGRLVRPGGRLFLVEPHHNVRRVCRLLRKYLSSYRAPEFWTIEKNWATHDFLTRGEIRTLCRWGGFGDVQISAFWFPYLRRFVPDPRRRFHLETRLARLPGLRHMAGIVAAEAVRVSPA